MAQIDQVQALALQEEKLGTALLLLLQIPRYRKLPLSALRAWLQPAVQHGQIVFAFNRHGEVVSYCTWAMLSADTLTRMQRASTVLHLSEWNEGPHLWLMELVGAGGAGQDMMAYLQDHFFADVAVAYWHRRRGGYVRRHRVGRRAYPSDDGKFHLPGNAFALSKSAWRARNNGLSTSVPAWECE